MARFIKLIQPTVSQKCSVEAGNESIELCLQHYILKFKVKSIIKYFVAAFVNWHPMAIKQCLTYQVSAENLSGHDISLICNDSLLP